MDSMRFDMRAPGFGASPNELYETAVDMCEWAKMRGCLAAVICEHHSSPDGYLQLGMNVYRRGDVPPAPDHPGIGVDHARYPTR